MNELVRPHQTRRAHQKALDRRRRKVRKTRLARVRRVQALRALRTVRFWTRAAMGATLFLCFAFWAKFAAVYDVPTFAQTGPLTHVSAYVAVKPWWFGPPVFDLGQYTGTDAAFLVDPTAILLSRLGRYHGIVVQPQMVWAERSAAQ